MHKLSNKEIAAAWHDLPDNTKKTMFAVGIKGYKKNKKSAKSVDISVK